MLGRARQRLLFTDGSYSLAKWLVTALDVTQSAGQEEIERED